MRCPLIFQSCPLHCPHGLFLMTLRSVATLVTLRSTENKVHPLLPSLECVLYLVSFQKSARSTKKLDGWAQMAHSSPSVSSGAFFSWTLLFIDIQLTSGCHVVARTIFDTRRRLCNLQSTFTHFIHTNLVRLCIFLNVAFFHLTLYSKYFSMFFFGNITFEGFCYIHAARSSLLLGIEGVSSFNL